MPMQNHAINSGSRVLMGTLNSQPQEYSRNIIGIYLQESFYSIIFLLHSSCSLFEVPIRTLLYILTYSTTVSLPESCIAGLQLT